MAGSSPDHAVRRSRPPAVAVRRPPAGLDSAAAGAGHHRMRDGFRVEVGHRNREARRDRDDAGGRDPPNGRRGICVRRRAGWCRLLALAPARHSRDLRPAYSVAGRSGVRPGRSDRYAGARLLWRLGMTSGAVPPRFGRLRKAWVKGGHVALLARMIRHVDHGWRTSPKGRLITAGRRIQDNSPKMDAFLMIWT